MNPHDLLQQILTFPIDEGTPAKTFASRLAHENDWSLTYTHRVILEYKRFIYLAMTADHVVTPSEQVDQAWHMHLTYTHSYWDRLCKEVLGRPLHHGPTRGGKEESVKYHDLYEQTLATYRNTFGQTPPADIWPAARDRFGIDLQVIRVNTAQNWVISKSAVYRCLTASLLAIIGVVLSTGCVGVFTNPFDLKGMEFFLVLIPALIAALFLGFAIRNTMRNPGPRDEDEIPPLNWAEIAYLAGGSERLVSATLARLVAVGAAKVSPDAKSLQPVSEQAHLLEKGSVEEAVYYALPLKQNELYSLKGLANRNDQVIQRVENLQELGYLMTPNQVNRAAYAAIVPAWGVLLFLAIPRLIFGLEGSKPIAFLVAFLIFTVLLGIVIVKILLRQRLTRRGSDVLSRLQKTGSATTLRDETDPDIITRRVSLFGTGVMASCTVLPLVSLSHWYARPGTSGGGGCGGDAGGGCGGGDAGGGCGGGGGGCGGGCGGCGS